MKDGLQQIEVARGQRLEEVTADHFGAIIGDLGPHGSGDLGPVEDDAP